MDCRSMEFVAVGWCTRKWWRLCKTLMGISLVLIQLRVTGLNKTRVIYLLDFFACLREEERRGSAI